MKQATFACTGGTYPINEQIATRDKKLGRGTGLGVGADGDPAFTLLANHPHMVASEIADKPAEVNPMLVRRLTPLECERLQGFPRWAYADRLEGQARRGMSRWAALQGHRQFHGGSRHEMDWQAYRGGR